MLSTVTSTLVRNYRLDYEYMYMYFDDTSYRGSQWSLTTKLEYLNFAVDVSLFQHIQKTIAVHQTGEQEQLNNVTQAPEQFCHHS